MSPRVPIIGGNFKCNGTCDFIEKHAAVLKAIPDNGVEVFVAPTALQLIRLRQLLEGSHIHVAAQNCYFEAPGAWTGEIAAELLLDAGIKSVIIGHSERRRKMGESDADSARKAAKALKLGMQVIFCVGETLEEREAGRVDEVIQAQLEALAALLEPAQWKNVVIAYEPVWSIGTGKVASPAQAQEVHASIRAYLTKRVSKEVAEEIRIQYGGSANAKNCGELARCPDIDGFLVGGASLKPEFADIVRQLGEIKLAK